jgi:hypothetical protein
MIKIKKFEQFFLNEANESAEKLLMDKISQIEMKLNELFPEGGQEPDETIKKFGEESEEETSSVSDAFKSLNRESLEVSKFSKTYKSLKLIFSDETFRYDMTFTIDLKSAVAPEGGEQPTLDSIENCKVELKRYNLEQGAKLTGSTTRDEVRISEINEDLFGDILAELDEDFEGAPEEEFELETEEENEGESENEESPNQ